MRRSDSSVRRNRSSPARNCSKASFPLAEYLQQVSEVLLYLLLPPADFQNRVTRVFLRELIANIVLLPVVDLITDPDYINQTIVWMVRQRKVYKSDTDVSKVIPSFARSLRAPCRNTIACTCTVGVATALGQKLHGIKRGQPTSRLRKDVTELGLG